MTMSNSSLLTSEEREICEQISKNDEGLYNQRARVLLALNEGMSQVEAGELAGLSAGQVKYCLQCFRQLRTASIFSTQTPGQITQAEPRFSSQIKNTDSKIQDSINQLKQTQDELNKSKAAYKPDEKNKLVEEPVNAFSTLENSSRQLKQTQDKLDKSKAAGVPDEKNSLTEEPDKKKKADKKVKNKKPEKKPKKLKNKKSKAFGKKKKKKKKKK